MVAGKSIALWGLAFKPNTDDIRGAPAFELASRLLAEGANLRLYDPKAMDRSRQSLPESDRVVYAGSALDAAKGAHALIVVTEWEEFKRADLADVKRVMTTPIIVDGRDIFSLEMARLAGVEYYPVGRPTVNELE